MKTSILAALVLLLLTQQDEALTYTLVQQSAAPDPELSGSWSAIMEFDNSFDKPGQTFITLENGSDFLAGNGATFQTSRSGSTENTRVFFDFFIPTSGTSTADMFDINNDVPVSADLTRFVNSNSQDLWIVPTAIGGNAGGVTVSNIEITSGTDAIQFPSNFTLTSTFNGGPNQVSAMEITHGTWSSPLEIRFQVDASNGVNGNGNWDRKVSVFGSPPASSVPEPSSYILLLGSLVTFGIFYRRRRRV